MDEVREAQLRMLQVQGDVALSSVQLAIDAESVLKQRANGGQAIDVNTLPAANIPGIVAYLQVREREPDCRHAVGREL